MYMVEYFKELYNLVGAGRIKRKIQKVTQMEVFVV